MVVRCGRCACWHSPAHWPTQSGSFGFIAQEAAADSRSRTDDGVVLRFPAGAGFATTGAGSGVGGHMRARHADSESCEVDCGGAGRGFWTVEGLSDASAARGVGAVGGEAWVYALVVRFAGGARFTAAFGTGFALSDGAPGRRGPGSG